MWLSINGSFLHPHLERRYMEVIAGLSFLSKRKNVSFTPVELMSTNLPGAFSARHWPFMQRRRGSSWGHGVTAPEAFKIEIALNN